MRDEGFVVKCANCKRWYLVSEGCPNCSTGADDGDMEIRLAKVVEEILRIKGRRMRIPIPREIRQQVKERNNGCCRLCRQRYKRLHIHHIDENHRNNTIDNLVSLCVKCHKKLHDLDHTPGYLRWILLGIRDRTG